MLLARDADVDAVLGALADGHSVAIVGEPGVGKTALLAAVCGRLAGPVLRGSCFATLQSLPFHCLATALHEPVVVGDDVAVAAHVVRRVREGFLVLDDLQWIDDATWGVLPLLLERVKVLAAVRTRDPRYEEVMAVLATADLIVRAVGPLPLGAGIQLVSHERPDLAPGTARAIAARAGGNPLLLRELARSGEPTDSLRRALSAQLRQLPAHTQATYALLAVLGHPVAVGRIDDQADALVEAGLVLRSEAAYALSHPLLGEIALDTLDEPTRKRLHRLAAELSETEGEAAQHLLAAGLTEDARELALRAARSASRPAEQARYLVIAAEPAPPEQAADLLIRAAQAFLVAGEAAAAQRTLDRLDSIGASRSTETELLRSQVAWLAGDDELSQESLERAAALLARGSEQDLPSAARLSAQLLLGRARLALFVDKECRTAEQLARQALNIARREGLQEVAASEYLIGTAQAVQGRSAYAGHLRRAQTLARKVGDRDVEIRASNNLVGASEIHGDHQAGLDIARTMAARCATWGLMAWVHQFRAMEANLHMLDADYHAALAITEPLLSGFCEQRTRDQLEVTRTIALMDLGRLGEARDQIARSLITATPHSLGRGQFEHLQGEVQLMAGRPGEAVRLLDVLAGRLRVGEELAAFVALTRSRALVALGRAPDRVAPWPEMPFFAAAPAEIRAGQLSASGDVDAAAALYADAARAWRPHYVRSALWCAWRAGESSRLANGNAEPLDLLRVEQEAADRGMVWLLGQVRQSLRKAGLRRTAPPRAAVADGPAGLGAAGLTGREFQVLTLAAQGLTNTQIGAELGLARRTVETQLASGRAKLHARSRSHAAANLHQQ